MSPLAAAADRLLEGNPAEADAALDSAALRGELVERGDFLVPAEDRVRLGATPWREEFAAWREAGFVFCLVKRHDLAPGDREALDMLFAELRRDVRSDMPPIWLTERSIVSLYLPDASDLRPVPSMHAFEDASAIHRICVTSFSRHLEREGRLRGVLGRRAPRAFPLGARYAASLEVVASLLGDSAAGEIATAFRSTDDAMPRSLFFDPKPANMVVRSSERPLIWSDPDVQTFRVDLDMLFWETPRALQLILTYFAFPVAFESGGDDIARLEGQMRRLIRSCEELDAGREEEVRDLVWYHLVRNFTGAAKAAHHDKALQMAELVLAATLSGDFVRAPALASALQQWIDENSGELRADHG